MKKFLKIMIPILIIVIIAALLFLYQMRGKTKFNNDYVNGNLQGNLYNEGTFCEYNGEIYFANPDDDYKLYSMDLTQKNVKKLCDDSVFYINADENYIYYIRNNQNIKSDYFFFSNNNNSLCRFTKKNKSIKVLDTDPCMYASLCGNYIYYLHYDTQNATTLYRIKIDGNDKKMVSEVPTLTCGALGQYIYYSGKIGDGNLYELDTATNLVKTLVECNCYNPIVANRNDIYYLDVSKNNALVHTSINAERPTVLSNDSIDLYNVYGSSIFYQNYDKKRPCLYKIMNDGSNKQEIMSGAYKRINVTSNYLFFTSFTNGTVYFTSTSNPGMIEEFHPGKQ